MSVNRSPEIGDLLAALAAAQAELEPAIASSVNPHLRNKFANLNAVISAARGPLARHGLAVTQHAITRGDLAGVSTTIGHRSGQWMSSELLIEISRSKGLTAAQCTGVAISYARRYAFAAVVGITTHTDTDGAVKRHPDTARRASRSAPTTPPPLQRNAADLVGLLVHRVGKQRGAWRATGPAADQVRADGAALFFGGDPATFTDSKIGRMFERLVNLTDDQIMIRVRDVVGIPGGGD